MSHNIDCAKASPAISAKIQDEKDFNEVQQTQHIERRSSYRHVRNKNTKHLGNKNKAQQVPQVLKEDSLIAEKLSQITQTTELPPLHLSEQKFAGNCRLFIGNLPSDVTEEELTSLFVKYGETNEVYINPTKTFAFIKIDYYNNALRAKTELFGYYLRGRYLVIRFAHPSAILVKNLSPNVTNELLHLAFGVFGEIENCYVLVDEKGKSKGKGVVEYVKKSSATIAMKKCSEGCFILTACLRPALVEKYEPWFDPSGFPEVLAKKNDDFYRERELRPRFAEPGTFEYDYAKRWKDLHEKYQLKTVALKNELFYEEQKLEADMKAAQYDHETERLKKVLQLREMDRERIKQEWELRQRQLEDRCLRERQSYRSSSSLSQGENALYLQASQLNSLLDREEQMQEQWHMANFTRNNSTYEQRNDYNLKQESDDSECWINLGESYGRGHKRQRV